MGFGWSVCASALICPLVAMASDGVGGTTVSRDVDGFDAMVEEIQDFLPATLDWETQVEVPIAFHVIHQNDGKGDLPDQWIKDQVAVLNDAYADTQFRFRLARVDRTARNLWFNWFVLYEGRIYSALAIEPARYINLYSADISGLGFSVIAGEEPENGKWNAAVLDYTTLPGAAGAPYNEGDNGVHEVGHYMGLQHTFFRGCNAPGDGVDDTPYERSPSYDCDETRDTCPAPGFDPVRNYMNEGNDACMVEFTPGQSELMTGATQLYRPTLLANACDLQLAITDFPAVVTPGSALDFSAEASNGCDESFAFDRVTLQVAGSADAELLVYDGAPVGVDPAGSFAGSLRLDVPANIGAGDYSVRLTLWRDDLPVVSDHFDTSVTP